METGGEPNAQKQSPTATVYAESKATCKKKESTKTAKTGREPSRRNRPKRTWKRRLGKKPHLEKGKRQIRKAVLENQKTSSKKKKRCKFNLHRKWVEIELKSGVKISKPKRRTKRGVGEKAKPNVADNTAPIGPKHQGHRHLKGENYETLGQRGHCRTKRERT